MYRQHVQRAAELTRRFRSVGFKSCVLKGVGMAQYYPEPERRLFGDIDLWVGPITGQAILIVSHIWLIKSFMRCLCYS